jgi:RNA polymerase sigma factor (sigma-70 family)
MCEDRSVAALVEKAVNGYQCAWNGIVRRYAPLVWMICRRRRISADADDVGGNVWLQLVMNLTKLREPAALPGWLATTIRRECLILLRNQNREISQGDREPIDHAEPGPDTWLLTEEQRNAIRDAVVRLPDRDRHLLSMLFSEPPTPYAKIGARLDMPIGAIGPTRQRCLARLRRSSTVASLVHDHHMETGDMTVRLTSPRRTPTPSTGATKAVDHVALPSDTSQTTGQVHMLLRVYAGWRYRPE